MIIGVVVAALLVGAVVLVTQRSSSTATTGAAATSTAPATTAAGAAAPSSSAAVTDPSAAGRAGGDQSTSSAPVASAAPSSVAPVADAPTTAPAPAPEPRTPKAIPVTAAVSNTSGLHDGAPVTIHVTPQGGSQAFAYEAFLCKADATFANDADIRPTQTGKCLPEPLSASSDNRTEVIGQAPYQALDGTFRVGVGSKTFKTQRGDTVTIACGAGNPCQLVLKLQYPNGFGFKTFPLSY